MLTEVKWAFTSPYDKLRKQTDVECAEFHRLRSSVLSSSKPLTAPSCR